MYFVHIYILFIYTVIQENCLQIMFMIYEMCRKDMCGVVYVHQNEGINSLQTIYKFMYFCDLFDHGITIRSREFWKQMITINVSLVVVVLTHHVISDWCLPQEGFLRYVRYSRNSYHCPPSLPTTHRLLRSACGDLRTTYQDRVEFFFCKWRQISHLLKESTL